jgi:HK97 family phage major capsid protein
MDVTIDEMTKRSQALTAQIRKSADDYEAAKKENKPWPEESRKAYDAACAEYDSLKEKIEEERNSKAISDRINQITEDEKKSIRHGKAKPGLDDAMPGEQRTYGDAGFDREGAASFAQSELDKRNALRSYFVHDAAMITEEMRESCQRLGFKPSEKSINVRFSDDFTFSQLQREARSTHPSRLHDLREQRVMSKLSTPGSELIPQTWINQVELAMIAYGPMLAYVSTLTTADGQKLNYPTGDDTGNSGALIAEGTEITTVADPTMSSITIDAFEYTSNFVKMPFTLARDSMVNIDLLIATLIGERMGRIYTSEATTGSGTSRIQGIRTASAAGVTAASATAIAGDDLIGLMHSVDPAYRPNGTFMAHDTIISAIRKLKATDGQYLWQSNLREGQPDTLLGKMIIPNAYMASTMASTNISVLYGDFSKYIFRRVGQGTLHRLTERYIEFLQMAFLFHQSADGRLIRANATTANPVKRLTH